MLITEEYRELNRELHATKAYGAGGGRWATKVENLREQYKCDDVLDYGCGQGWLKHRLKNPDWIKEYDPAVRGKDTSPDRADMVVCTDVLEHIEPALLDNVLAHIQDRAKKIVLLNISTRPASKTLSDGRNAHLIVEPADWWEAKLAPYFKIETWDVGHDSLTVVALRQVKISENLIHKSAVETEVRLANMRANVGKTSGRMVPLPAHEKTAILCCYGPSLLSSWPEAKLEREQKDTRLATVSGAHDFMIERGVIPDYHLECDPREHKCKYTEHPAKGTKYLLASCVYPKMLDQIIDQACDVYLWHAISGAIDIKEITDIEATAFGLAGGGSIGLRAMNALFAMGFRRFKIHGMDCSFSESDGGQHAGEHFGKAMSESQVRCGDRWFKSSLAMVAYARYFLTNVKILIASAESTNDPILNDQGDRLEIQLHGDGLLQEMVKQANGAA